ncbi:MAG TPA: hypothetical protein VIO64_18235 [Pseudobacteroides sp.]|uniref:hypothetical protein n=1 Tax=Pseudobacteroides sp. TaxID=1968840 RepID=UPI002F93B69C
MHCSPEWNGCKADVCDENQHVWDGCVCSICGIENHEWQKSESEEKCVNCKESKE